MNELREKGVSICCITYNHAEFIKKTLDSFLMQKTNFPYEIIVHDDASTDGTTEILLEYQKKYPNQMQVLLENENQFSKGIRVMPALVLPKAKGKYIAISDGDDHWTDQYKLQEQHDFMESHPNVSYCFHNAVRYNLKTGEKSEQIQNLQSGYIDDEELILGTHGSVPTVSCFFRTEFVQEIPDFNFRAPVGDDPLRYYYACRGDIYYLSQTWAIRNFMHKESWNYKMQDKDVQDNYIKKYLIYLQEFNEYSKKRFDSFIEIRKHRLSERWHYLFLPGEYAQKDLKEQMIYFQEETEHKMDELFIRQFNQYLPQCNDYLDEKIKSFLDKAKRKHGKLFLYGCGEMADFYAKRLENCGISYQGFVVSNGHKKLNRFRNHLVWELSELESAKEQAYIWLCINEINTGQALPNLEKMGFCHILYGEYKKEIVWREIGMRQ